MKVQWRHIVELNRVLCNMVGQPHAVRHAMRTDAKGYVEVGNIEQLSRKIANEHPFVDGNKRTAVCTLVSVTLKDL